MSGISIGVVELLDTSREEIPAARLAIWRQYKQKSPSRQRRDASLMQKCSWYSMPFRVANCRRMQNRLLPSCRGHPTKCNGLPDHQYDSCAARESGTCVRIIEQADQLIQPDSPQYAVYRAESVCAKQLVGVSVPEEEVNQAISYFKEQMKNPKKLHDAAGRLGALLSTTMLSGWWGKLSRLRMNWRRLWMKTYPQHGI